MEPVCPLCSKAAVSQMAFITKYGSCVHCYDRALERSGERDAELLPENDWDPMDPCGYYDDRGR